MMMMVKMMMVFLVILIFILQFCGQGAITFYTVRIFKVVLDAFTSIIFAVFQMFNVDKRVFFFINDVVQDACSVVEAKDCALVIGVTYFLSALLRWS